MLLRSTTRILLLHPRLAVHISQRELKLPPVLHMHQRIPLPSSIEPREFLLFTAHSIVPPSDTVPPPLPPKQTCHTLGPPPKDGALTVDAQGEG